MKTRRITLFFVAGLLDAAAACNAGSTNRGESTAATPSSDAAVLDAGRAGARTDAGRTGARTDAGRATLDAGPRLSGAEIDCTVTVTSAEVSPDIATVGIVSFTADLVGLTAAEIHFGLDTNYEWTAPVELTQEGHRTLLLGMIENSTYHYRIVVSDGTSVCHGEDQTIETGSLGAAALAEAVTSDAAAPGFMVTARDGKAVIYNKRGELVWAYDMWNVFSVQLSWDGKYMIGRDPGPFDLSNGGSFYRVEMDGSNFATLDAPGGDHHDFAPIPDGIAYLAKANEGECDLVYEASIEITDGAPVFDTWQIYQYFPDEGAREGTEICHSNRIHYSAEKELYTLSDRNKDALAIFSKSGTPIASIGKAPSGAWSQHIQAEGAGPGGDWHVQHGHHFYADDKLVLYSNESSGGSAMLHYTISGETASLDWKYSGAGRSMIQGDVQHLPNGNFLVTANLSGTIVEVAPDGQTEVGRYVLSGAVGPLYGFTYTTHRPTLYGPPPAW